MDRDTHIGGPHDRFPVTRHSIVGATADPDPTVRERALEALIASYWKPAYKYVRLKWNADNEETKDLIQGFFAVALEKQYLARFDPTKARFRTYLRTCLDGFVSNERKAAQRLKRGGAYHLVSLDFEDAEGELRQHDIPDDVDFDAMFHHEWVRSLFALSVDALREHCERTDRPLHFALFERYDLQADEAAGRPSYAALAEEFGVEVTKITNTLHAARKLFRQLLLERLAEICGSEEEFQREAQELLGDRAVVSWLSDDALRRLQAAASEPDLDGTRYELVEPIGQGGMGTVYRARDHKLDRHVALKVLSVPKLSEAIRERMLREARILARLEHPGIVPVHDVGTLPDGRVYYAMKLVQGQRLDEHLRTHSSVGELLRVFERMCEAVGFAHAHGVIHRDLKPENVMVGTFGEVLVMDWGVAKILEDAARPAGDPLENEPAQTVITDGEPPSADTLPLESSHTHPGTVLGTPGYMSPEQAAGRLEQVDRRSDVYALGVILDQFLGQSDRPVPRRLRAIVDKARAAKSAARYDSVERLAQDIARYREGAAVTAHREGPWETLGRFVHRYRTPILLILAYLVVRVALLVFADV